MELELRALSSRLDPGQFHGWKKQSVINFVLEQVEVMLYPKLRGRTIQDLVHVDGLQHLEQALGKKRGVLLLTAHFGSNQLIMPALASRGFRINQIAGQPIDWSKLVGKKPGRIETQVLKIKTRLEASLPATFHYIRSSSGLRSLFRCLQENQVLIAAFDGRAGARWTEVPLLERTALVSQGPVQVAVRVGSPILPAFVIRKSWKHHELVIHAPLHVDEETDPPELLRAFSRIFSTCLLAHPEQYLWLLHVAHLRSALDEYPLFADYDEKSGNVGEHA